MLKGADEFHPLLLEGDRQSIGTALFRWLDAGLTARVVRGRKMRNRVGLFDEFAAALQFPYYFGENWNAFDECIADLETLPAGEGYVVTITEPDQVLADAGPEELRWLVETLETASAEWSQPVNLGQWWDRPAIPFHVVLAGERAVIESAARRWSAAGALPWPIDMASEEAPGWPVRGSFDSGAHGCSFVGDEVVEGSEVQGLDLGIGRR